MGIGKDLGKMNYKMNNFVILYHHNIHGNLMLEQWIEEAFEETDYGHKNLTNKEVGKIEDQVHKKQQIWPPKHFKIF